MVATVVVRRIAATPARSAAASWTLISDLIAPRGSSARQELDRIAGIAMSLIADEAARENPMVVSGVGSRLRVYCVYSDEAVLGEGLSEEPLSWCPTDGNWAMSLPCSLEDLAWVQSALSRITSRVTARDKSQADGEQPQGKHTGGAGELPPINREAFLRP